MGKVAEVLGFGGGEGLAEEAPLSAAPEEELLETDVEEPAKGGSAEVMAMKMFERATTPEAKVEALKGFLEACGVMSY